MKQAKARRGFQRCEQGASLIETALLAPVLVLLAVGAVDFGRGYYAAIEVQSAADAGAIYGLQDMTDTAGMQSAATLNAPDVAGVSALASWGCECSDGTGTSASCATTPTCSATVVNYVQVTTTATYTPMVAYPGIPASIALSGSAKLREGQ